MSESRNTRDRRASTYLPDTANEGPVFDCQKSSLKAGSVDPLCGFQSSLNRKASKRANALRVRRRR
jgi:hypothetical protein